MTISCYISWIQIKTRTKLIDYKLLSRHRILEYQKTCKKLLSELWFQSSALSNFSLFSFLFCNFCSFQTELCIFHPLILRSRLITKELTILLLTKKMKTWIVTYSSQKPAKKSLSLNLTNPLLLIINAASFLKTCKAKLITAI